MEETMETKTQEFPLRMGKDIVVKNLGELREKYNELAVMGEYHLGRLERGCEAKDMGRRPGRCT